MVDHLDDRLMRVLLQGPSALPEDMEHLEACLAVVRQLTEEFSTETEENWEAERSRQSEVETLLALEESIAARVAATRLDRFCDVLRKLAVWQALMDANSDGYEISIRDRIVQSVSRDLENVLVSGTCFGQILCAQCQAQTAQ